MYKARGSAAVDISREEAWEKLSDLSLAPEYVPGVNECKFITDSRTGLGAARRVFPMEMDEKVVLWDEGREIRLDLSKKGEGRFFPFRKAQFSYRLTDYEPCILVLSLEYEPYFGKLGQLVFGRTIRKRIKETALSMQRYYNQDVKKVI